MAYYLDLFSPETYEAFSRSDRTVSGFRPGQRAVAARVRPGDRRTASAEFRLIVSRPWSQ